ncbi:MAG: phenylalanine--tRNA ligase subunit beta [bacterium]
MQISYKWLIELTGLDWSPEEIGDRLTLCGIACEHIEPTSKYLDKVVVGQVVNLEAVAGADKIRLATVDIGTEQLSIICGAPNVEAGHKVPVATLGAVLAGDLKIKKVKIRGVESSGMICSERELGISEDHAGIIILDETAVVGRPLVEHLDYDDCVMTFEMTPNRPDALSAIGIARDLATLAGVELRRPEFELIESGSPASDFISVRIDDPGACPRYAARIIRGVTIGESPWWLKKKLLTCGMRPINSLVDITNLVMLECGHPLHAFDLDRFGSSEVVMRRAAQGEKFTTLDGRDHTLTPDVLMITNGKEGVAAGGIMGGLNSEVASTTTNILLEAAYFDPSTIRKGRRVLNLSTESSYRFERGCDPNGIDWAINRAASLFASLCGGEVCCGIVDCYPTELKPTVVSFRPQRCHDVVGVEYDTERIAEIFKRLGFEIQKSDPWQVSVPTYRPDIGREIDLIEEVVRIQGFDSVPDAIHNTGPLYSRTLAEDQFAHEVRRLLNGVGFDEMMGHGLADGKQAEFIAPEVPIVRLANSISEELNVMRNSLMVSALTVVSHNLSHRVIDLRLFEIGKVYFAGRDNPFVEEPRLSLVVTGCTPAGWREAPRPLDFYDLTGALAILGRHFGWPEFEFEPGNSSLCLDEVSFIIKLAGTTVGTIGQLKPKVLGRFDIKQPVFAAELRLEPLLAAVIEHKTYRPVPIYPAAPRDLAIVIKEDVRAAEVVDCIRQAAGKLARKVQIFDLYQGKQIAKGLKSMAVHVVYRSAEKSLSGDEVDGYQARVIQSLKKQFNAEIRDK